MLGLRRRRGKAVASETPAPVEDTSSEVSTSRSSRSSVRGFWWSSGKVFDQAIDDRDSSLTTVSSTTIDSQEAVESLRRARKRRFKRTITLLAVLLLGIALVPFSVSCTFFPLYGYLKLFTRTNFRVPIEFVPLGENYTLVAQATLPSDRFYYSKSISASLNMVLPESDGNFATNSFKVFMDVENLAGETVGSYASVTSMRFRSSTIRTLRAWILLVPLLSGLTVRIWQVASPAPALNSPLLIAGLLAPLQQSRQSEYQTVRMTFAERLPFTAPTPPVKTIAHLHVQPSQIRISEAVLEIQLHRSAFPILALTEFRGLLATGLVLVWTVSFVSLLVFSLAVFYLVKSNIAPYIDFYREPSLLAAAGMVLPLYLLLPVRIVISLIQNLT
uniref:Seipin n=1 Tax=Rhodosorus marinus TaxID=101924 RepID=A0A7S3A3J6_9RHOD